MRIAITIILNGSHHLDHNDYGNKLPKMVDYWIIVEGAALPHGSTFWCNDPGYRMSMDNTFTKILELAYNNNHVSIKTNPWGAWKSKDEMVNAGIELFKLRNKHISFNDPIFLWQIDADEQWTKEQMDEAEKKLVETDGDCGCFLANHFVGKDLVAKGCWGEGNNPEEPIEFAYHRLWRWKGQRFMTHEPPCLVGGNGKEVLLPQRFNHYSYVFEKDVIFKSQYYKGYENLHTKWKALQEEVNFPQPISKLLDGYWAETPTTIERYPVISP